MENGGRPAGSPCSAVQNASNFRPRTPGDRAGHASPDGHSGGGAGCVPGLRDLEDFWEVDGGIAHLVSPLDHRAMEEGALVDLPRLAERQIETARAALLRKVLPLRALRQEFQRPPRACQRVVELAERIGWNVGMRAVGQRRALGHMCEEALVEAQPIGLGLARHPDERELGELALALGMAAAHIGMAAREPYGPLVLRWAGRPKGIGPEFLARRPLVQAE